MTTFTNRPVSPLRQRMLDDMLMRGHTALIFGGSRALGRNVAGALAVECVVVAVVARIGLIAPSLAPLRKRAELMRHRAAQW